MGSPEKFVQDNFEATARTIFSIYDVGNTNFIDREEFVKMLFNYPKGDIYKFYDEVSDAAALPANTGPSMELRTRRHSVYNPFMMESVCNLGALVGDRNSFMSRNTGMARDINAPSGDNSQISGQSGEDYPRSSRRGSEYYNSSIMGGSNEAQSVRGSTRNLRKESVSRKVRANKILPTNFQNKIGIWTDAIYEKYGEGNRLFFNGFLAWAQKHQAFIMGFRKYFRYNLWKRVVNPRTNQTFLSYVTQTPVLQHSADILLGLSAPIKNGYVMLYADFLLVWPTDNWLTLPARILILKNIRILSDGAALTIQFNHESKRYRPLKLGLSRPAVWRFWKDTLDKYSR